VNQVVNRFEAGELKKWPLAGKHAKITNLRESVREPNHEPNREPIQGGRAGKWRLAGKHVPKRESVRQPNHEPNRESVQARREPVPNQRACSPAK
jgi:hypothetical protein